MANIIRIYRSEEGTKARKKEQALIVLTLISLVLSIARLAILVSSEDEQ